jgi:hypothetical protein
MLSYLKIFLYVFMFLKLLCGKYLAYIVVTIKPYAT